MVREEACEVRGPGFNSSSDQMVFLLSSCIGDCRIPFSWFIVCSILESSRIWPSVVFKQETAWAVVGSSRGVAERLGSTIGQGTLLAVDF